MRGGEDLRCHKEINHGIRGFFCDHCGIPAKREGIKEWHRGSVHVLARIICDNYGKIFDGIDTMGRHVRRVHKEPSCADLGQHRERFPRPRAGIRPPPSSRPAPCPPPSSSPAPVQAYLPPHTQTRPSCLVGLWVCERFTPGIPPDTPVQASLLSRFMGGPLQLQVIWEGYSKILFRGCTYVKDVRKELFRFKKMCGEGVFWLQLI